MPIQRFLMKAAFDQTEIDLMVGACEAVLKLLKLTDRNDPLCELVVSKVIEAARSGEGDARCRRGRKKQP